MKILEAQSATLTNYEVYTHLLDQERRFALREAAKKKAAPKQTKRKASKEEEEEEDEPRPKALGTVTREILEYLRAPPAPLGSEPFPYHENTIRNLLEGLRPWNFTKGEIIMILNLRPSKPENLNTIIEEMEGRFPGDEEQMEILKVIGDVLGRPNDKANIQAMTENATKAREYAAIIVPIHEED